VPVVLANGFVLSGLYLVLGILVEAARRAWPGNHLVLRCSFALDALPSQVLERLGLTVLLRDAYTWGRVNPFELRVVFGVTTMTVILLLAAAIAAFLWGAQRMARGRAPP
jgi:hypothetical protein